MKNIHFKRARPWLTSFSSLFLSTMIVATATAERNSSAYINNKSDIPHKTTRTLTKSQTIFGSNSQTLIRSDGTYQVQLNGQGFSRSRSINNYIHLRRGGKFDPLSTSIANRAAFDSNSQATTPELYAANASAKLGAYIVQFHTQALPGYQQTINEYGGIVTTSFPPNSILVLINRGQIGQLKTMNSVRAVVPFLPIYKLQEGLEHTIANKDNQKELYSIMSITKNHSSNLQKFVRSIGGEVIGTSNKPISVSPSSRFSAKLTPTQLLYIAQSPYTLFIDVLGDPDGEDVDDVRERGGFNWLESVANYTGQGVGIEVYDRGFQVNHQELLNTPNPILVRSPEAEGSGGGDHGTDISGILFAQGVDPKYRGLLPDASRPIVFSRYSGFPGTNQPSESELRGHLAELVDPNGPYRAVVQTSSTDYARTLDYTTWSAEYDEVLFDLDLIKTQSQSNSKDQMSRPAAWAKNVVSVGGIKTLSTLTRSDDGWNSSASIGPAADNRIKPDLSGQYDAFDMIADGSGTTYNARNGTSFSTPAVAGAFGILFQMWADGVFDGGPGKQGAPEFRDVFDVRPHASTAKALMIHTAFQYDFDTGDSHNLSRIKQGWGFPDVKNLYEIAQQNNWRLPILVNEEDILLPGGANSYTLTVDGSKPLKATLAYKDPRGNPAASIARINDLSLKVTSPSGTVYWGNNGLRQGIWSTPGGVSNTIDTIENVFIQAPQAGSWSIEVLGDDIVQDGHVQTPELDADYALVVTGGVSSNTAPIAHAGSDGSIQLPNNFSLNGSVIDDAFPGTTLTTTWSQISGPGVTNFVDASSPTTTASFDMAGTYTLRLTANDGEFTDSDETIITVSQAPQNQPPVANAGVHQSIELPSAAVLSASCNDDGLPIGSSVSSTWVGNANVNFANPNVANTTATFTSPGTYSLTFTCDDSELTASDISVVTVIAEQPNQAPSANAGGNISTIAGVTVSLNASANDDGRPFGSNLTTTWTMTSGPGTASFSDPNALNSNVTFSSAGVYQLSLTASDGSLSTTDTLDANVSEMPVDLSNDNFETSIGNWSNTITGDSYDWTRDSSGTPSSGTGPDSGAGSSSWYMYLETSNGSGAFNAGDTAILESSSLDGINRLFSFDYHMFGTDIGTLNVDVSVNGGNWINVWTITGQQHTSNSAAYSSASIDLGAYSGSIKVRFRAIAAGGYRGDIAVDNPVLTGIDVPPQNQAPTVNAGSDQTIELPNEAVLSGICNDDGLPAGNNLSCVWSGPAGVNFANTNSGNTTASFNAPGTYALTLTANDGELGNSDMLYIIVNPAPANQAPTANAGGNQDAFLSSGITLNGSCSDDGLPTGSTVTANWTGGAGVNFSDANSANTSATFSNIGSYIVNLSCSDGALSGSDSATINVTDTPTAPVQLTADNFEAGLGNWSNNTNGDSYDWSRNSGGTPSSSTGPSSGSNASSWYLYLETSNGSGAYNSSDTAILTGPTVTANNVHLKFDYHLYGSDIGTLSVDVLSGGSWANNVWSISGQQQSSNGATYSSVDVDLSTYSVQQLRFRATAAGGYRGDMAIDNVEIWGVEGPVAPTFSSNPLNKPSATQDQTYNDSIAGDASDGNGDSLSFSKISGPSWLSIASNGSLSGTPSSADLGNNSFQVEVSDGALSSQTTMMINVNDGSTPVVISSTDFESDLGDWINPTGEDNYDWTRNSGGTPSSSTGPTSGANGSNYYVFLETSDGGRGAFNAGETAYLESTYIGGSNRTLTFDYHMYGTEIGTLAVDVFENGSWQLDAWQISGQQQSSGSATYDQVSVDLTSYTGTIKFRLRATAAGGWKGDIAVDNLVVMGTN